MKKNKKILVLLALFLAVFAVGGTLAYLTDTTETMTNTFTFGKVNISLTEPHWVEADAEGVTPGQDVAKDPTVKVEAGSKDAFVFVKVEVPAGQVGDPATTQPLFSIGSLGSGWTLISTETDGNTGDTTYVYGYGSANAMTSVAANTTLPAVFSEVTVNPNLTSDNISNITGATADINVSAYAIQADDLNVTTPTAIWGVINS